MFVFTSNFIEFLISNCFYKYRKMPPIISDFPFYFLNLYIMRFYYAFIYCN